MFKWLRLTLPEKQSCQKRIPLSCYNEATYIFLRFKKDGNVDLIYSCKHHFETYKRILIDLTGMSTTDLLAAKLMSLPEKVWEWHHPKTSNEMFLREEGRDGVCKEDHEYGCLECPDLNCPYRDGTFDGSVEETEDEGRRETSLRHNREAISEVIV